MAGRGRTFAFQKLASYDEAHVQKIRDAWQTRDSTQHFYGSDRNVNVIGFSNANAKCAGIDKLCSFSPTPLSEIKRPEGQAGLVMVNPPYGARIGKKNDLVALYTAFGTVMRERFKGWRVGMVTSDTNLAQCTKLPWLPADEPIAHGGLKVNLFRTDVL